MRNFALDFNHAQNVQAIVKPLAERIGIVGFFLIRRYPDGTFINITSEPNWAEFFYNRFYQQDYAPHAIVNHMLPSNNISLSILNAQNEIWQEGREYFNVGNGITLSKQFEHYHESYTFYAHKDNHDINYFYLNNLDLLQRFVDYFKPKATEFIIQSESNRFHTPEKYLANSLDKIIPINDYLEIKQLQQQFHHSPELIESIKLLSKKELECLYYLVQGNSAAEIAHIIFRSKRTVEQHIENAKHKLNCHKISQLAYLLGKMNIEKMF
jgi:DNA-binding CsgD family transcriptional regulator